MKINQKYLTDDELINFKNDLIPFSKINKKYLIDIINKMSDQYDLQHEFKQVNFSQYRSAIIRFYKYLHKKNIDFDNVTQKNIDDYLKEYQNKIDSPNTYNAHSSYLKILLTLFPNELNNISFDNFDFSSEDILDWNKKSKNSGKALSIEEIERIKQFYSEDPQKLLYIEALLTYRIFHKDIINYLENSDSLSINTKINGIQVENYFLDLINVVKQDKYSSDRRFIENIDEELVNNKIISHRFRQRDINETKDSIFIKCPECSNLYEASSDNWALKQYYQNGKKWIVCKHCGRNNNHE